MKFFTKEWWMGLQGTGPVTWPVDEYQAHLTRINDRLPGWFIDPDFSLHDSRLRTLSLNVEDRSLVMELEPVARVVHGVDQEWGVARLSFSGVQFFETTADPDVGLRGPHGYGDWGYEELDVTPDGTIEMQVLFSTGVEFRILFAGFEATWLRTTQVP